MFSRIKKTINRIKSALVNNKNIDIRDIYETIDEICKSNKSLIRYGDGEFCLMMGNSIRFQNAEMTLSNRLIEISKEASSTDRIVCVPYALKDTSFLNEKSLSFWTHFKKYELWNWYQFVDFSKKYYSTEVNRPFKDFKDRTISRDIFLKWKQVWEKRDIVIIEGNGGKMGMNNDLFTNSNTISRIILPNKNAWSYYPELFQYIIENVTKEQLILISLGPTATVLAYDLSKYSYRALDIGHIDGEYDFMKKYGLKSDIVVTEFDVEKKSRDELHEELEKEYKKTIIKDFCR